MVTVVQINEKLKQLPTDKLVVVFDFISYLLERESALELLQMQAESSGYREWLNTENDIYDEVFQDELPTR